MKSMGSSLFLRFIIPRFSGNVNKGVHVKTDKNGICYLVGAGPGDPGLLTLRGKECLARADIVFYDYLAAESHLVHVPVAAKKICVGKAAGAHSVPQEETNRLLVAAVRAGQTVVRLKGGDPFVFGRGGEEALMLATEGLAFEVVPGVTSGVAAAAYAGIPVTHRGLSTAVTFVTGNESPDKEQSQTDWAALAQGGQTVCIYMGMMHLAELAGLFIRYGRSPGEPVAVIRYGTLAVQRVVMGTLADIAGKVDAAGLQPPGLIVIGPVVALRGMLNWFENRPLFGKRVIVTRSREQAGTLTALLQEEGAQVVELPAIHVRPVPLDCPPPLQRILTRRTARAGGEALDCNDRGHLLLLQHCDTLTRAAGLLLAGWPDYVVFTSVNGVENFFFRLAELGLDARLFAGSRLAVIGPATGHALCAHGLQADVLPPVYTGEGLLEALLADGGGIAHGCKFLLLRADNAREMLSDALVAAGALVEDLIAYYLEPVMMSTVEREHLLNGGVAAVTFASSGTVRNFVDAMNREMAALLNATPRPLFISIGPVTSETMRELGLPIDAEAGEATIPALAQALREVVAQG